MRTDTPQFPNGSESLSGQIQNRHFGGVRLLEEVRHDHNSLSEEVGVGCHPSVAQPSHVSARAQMDGDYAVAVAEIVTPASKLTVATPYEPVLCCDPAAFDEHQSSPPAILHPELAAEGARVAAGIVRDQRLRDLLSAVEEWRRASGPDRSYWRGHGSWLIRQWRRDYEAPERAAFQAAVARSRQGDVAC